MPRALSVHLRRGVDTEYVSRRKPILTPTAVNGFAVGRAASGLLVAFKGLAEGVVFGGDTGTWPWGPTPGLPTYSDRQVTISAGQNWQSIIDANPSGTIYGIAAGVHTVDRARFKAGDVAVGQDGAIMDGGWNQSQSRDVGFDAPIDSWGSGDNGKLINLEIRNYLGFQRYQCAINGGLEGWRFDRLWIHHIGWGGIKLDNNAQLTHSLVEWCGQINIKCEGDGTFANRTDNILCEDVITRYGNGWNWEASQPYGWQDEGGGSKFPADCTNVTLRRCSAYQNIGGGLWFDGGLYNLYMEDCVAYDNAGPGLFYELSEGPGHIQDCHAWNNGGASEVYPSNCRGSGTGSQAIHVRRNLIESGMVQRATSYQAHTALWQTDVDTRSPRLGYVETRDNEIYLGPYGSGLDLLAGDFPSSASAAPGMVWERNNYYVDSSIAANKGGQVFQIHGANATWSQWQADGRDLDGSYTLI